MALDRLAVLGIKVDPRGAVSGSNVAKRSIMGIGGAASKAKSAVFSLQGALIGLGAGAVSKSIITTAAEVESLGVRLKFLTGSAEDGAKALEDMIEYASKVPFTLQDIQMAAPSLLVVADNVNELNDLLTITGDLAAVSGLSFAETGMQLQRAMAGGIASADLFRERGISAFLGFEAGVSYSGERTKRMIKDMWRDGTTTAAGATLELADTFQGQVSMMQDAWFKMKLAIADTGVFEEASKVIVGITEGLSDPSFKSGVEAFSENLLSLFRFSVDHKDELLAVGGVFLGGKIGGVLGKKGAALGAAAGGILAYQDSLAELLGVSTPAGSLDSLAAIDAAMAKVSDRIDGLYDLRNNGKISLRSMNIQLEGLTAHWEQLSQAREKYLSGITVIEVTSGAKQDRGLNDITESLAALNKEASLLDSSFESLQALGDEAAFQEYLTNLQAVADQVSAIREANHQAAMAVKSDWQMAGEAIGEAFNNVKDSVVDTLTDALMVTQSWGDAMRSILRDIQRQFIRNQIVNPFVNAISGALPSPFAGARANGGPVSSGSTYLVGERGPELFTPKSSGQIVPNEAMGGQTVNVTFNINANDTRGFDELLASRRGTIMGVINQALNDSGRPALT